MKSTAKPDSETKAGASKAYGAVAATCIWAPSKVHRRSNRKLVLLSGLLSKVFPCYPKEPFFFSSTGSLNPQTRKPPISHPSTFQTEISASHEKLTTVTGSMLCGDIYVLTPGPRLATY